MYCVVYFTCVSEKCDNKSLKAKSGEMDIFYSEVLMLYVKWYNIN